MGKKKKTVSVPWCVGSHVCSHDVTTESSRQNLC